MGTSNYKLENLGSLEKLNEHAFRGQSGKLFIGEKIALTGSEISLNRMAAGDAMPFAHAHRQNEEVYVILGGQGVFFLDGEEIPVQEGSILRIDPPVHRSWRTDGQELYFICIQAKQNTLGQHTISDGFLVPTLASWMKPDPN